MDWSIKDELGSLLRGWPVLVAAILLGGLLGWITALVLPPAYEAEARLSVSFNGDSIYLSADDFKHWQLAELSAFVLSDKVLAATLAVLHTSGDGFGGWTEADLRALLEPRWRNAGVWQLVVRGADPAQVSRIAQAWRDAVLAESAVVLGHAAKFHELDQLYEARARSIGLLDLELARMREVNARLLSALNLPEAEALPSLLADLHAAGAAVPVPFPEPGAGPEAVSDWLSAASAAAVDRIRTLERLQAGQRSEYDLLGEQWMEELEASLGFSAYLLVEAHEDAGITVTPDRSAGAFSLAGALVGVMALIGYRLARLSLRTGHETDR